MLSPGVKKMDKILFHEMEFYGYHGVYPEENRIGQRFRVDLELKTDLSVAGKSDDLSDTINYADVYETVKAMVEGERYQLVEALAERIAAKLLSRFSLDAVLVRVTKPDPPIPGHYKAVAVEIERSRA